MGADAEVALPRHLQQPDGVRVLTYLRPAARARLYGDTIRVPDREAGRRLVQDPAFDPFRTLVLEGAGAPERAGTPHGRVSFLDDDAHRVRLRVESDRSAWLFLADAFAEGWSASVDGTPVPIRVGMVAFRAVRVPAGTSTVEFRYEPKWLRVVPYSAGLGILLLMLSFAGGRPGKARPRVSG